MIYQRTLVIGKRFSAHLDLIQARKHSKRTSAASLYVSESALSRCLAASRHCGYQIEPRRKAQAWCFLLVHDSRGVPVAHK